MVMEFLDSDLGQLSAGASVTVILSGTEANVILIEDSSLPRYKAQRGGFKYVGGHFKRSPVVLSVPHQGHWHALVDLGGAVGEVKASVSVTPA
jgi:hypothetical protein